MSDTDVFNPHGDWVEIQVLRVGRVVRPVEDQCVVMMISFSNQDVSDVNLVHKLKSREEVERIVAALQRSADKLWPAS